MKWTSGFALGFAVAGVAACGGEDAAGYGGYGTGMPGSGLVEGGEALLEKVYLEEQVTGSADIIFNQFHAYQYSGSFEGPPLAPIAGECFAHQHPDTFPVHDLPATAEHIDWGANITLSGPGLGGGVTVPKVIAGPDGLVDNRPSPVRTHKEGSWLYGGPTWQGDNFQDVDIQEGVYTLDLGDRGEVTFNFPPAYDFAGDAGTEPLVLADGEAWDATWEAIPNPDTPHSREHSFVFLAFAQFPGEGDLGPTPLYICLPPDGEDGSFTVPQSVIDDLPAAGIFQTGRLTHYMEALADDDGVERRFDLFSIYCSVSLYTKE